MESDLVERGRYDDILTQYVSNAVKRHSALETQGRQRPAVAKKFCGWSCWRCEKRWCALGLQEDQFHSRGCSTKELARAGLDEGMKSFSATFKSFDACNSNHKVI